MPKQNVAKLMRKVNDLIGKETLLKLYNGLSDPEYNELQRLMMAGKMSMHNDGYIGFSAVNGGAYTSECFFDSHLDVGDTVKVNSKQHLGKQGKILAFDSDKEMARIEGINKPIHVSHLE